MESNPRSGYRATTISTTRNSQDQNTNRQETTQGDASSSSKMPHSPGMTRRTIYEELQMAEVKWNQNHPGEPMPVSERDKVRKEFETRTMNSIWENYVMDQDPKVKWTVQGLQNAVLRAKQNINLDREAAFINARLRMEKRATRNAGDASN